MINSNNNILGHRIIGDGYPVVFLHGFLEDSSMWDYLNLELTGIQAIFIDLPAHGSSKDIISADSLPKIAELVEKTLTSLKISSYKLIGHSLGGYVALELLKLKNKPTEICLYSSHPFSDTEIRKDNRTRLLRMLDHKFNTFLAEAIPDLFHHPELVEDDIEYLIIQAKLLNVEGVKSTVIAMRDRMDYCEIIEKHETPLTLVQGELDTLIDISKLKRWCKSAEKPLHLIKMTSHMSHIEKTEEVNILLNQFISI